MLFVVLSYLLCLPFAYVVFVNMLNVCVVVVDKN